MSEIIYPKNSEGIGTRPEYRCAKCGLGISADVHYTSHPWQMPPRYKSFWMNKETGLVPLGGVDADK